ncbi:MAG: 3'(2'),5'-bisphosphate nucleotidase CysQ [Bacteroidales bacterium]
MNRDKLAQNLEYAVIAAMNGGNEIMNIYTSESIKIETKEDNSPVTQADIAASDAILKILEQTHIPIICEETAQTPFSERKNWEYVWIVDPLDGTKEFISRNDEFTVNIALIHNNTPVLGVIYVPADDSLYFGTNTDGAYTIQQTSIVLPDFRYSSLIQYGTSLPFFQESAEITIVASKSHKSAETELAISEIQKKHPHAKTVSIGSSLKFCIVANGHANIYPRFGPTCEWDTAAGDAIARASGCKTYNTETHEPLLYNNKEDFFNPYFIVERT